VRGRAVAIGTGTRKLVKSTKLLVTTEGLSIGWLYTPLRGYEDTSYTRTLSQKFTTDCSAQNLDGPFLLEMNAQWPPWSGATR
jgi:hypothetical protein